ncbi:uncharacterized protein LOC122672218 [Telopea speciosissima]|uniref:uncharacterized protein LOC122672218 n=1 Tax=Telopea speciosissima TaxID=54955 RepID=UPI001CC447F1|nr:uncharacterized protein LOC122672218 [Telopea speciosissima]
MAEATAVAVAAASALVIFDCDSKLTGPNYVDWYRSIKLLLTAEIYLSVLDEQPPQESHPDDDPEYIEFYENFIVRESKASLYIQGSIDKTLVDSIKDLRTAGGKMEKLAELFNRQLTHAHYDMRLETMGIAFNLLYKTNVILKSLPGSYAPFRMSYKISNRELELTELATALVETEKTLKGNKPKVNTTDAKPSSKQKKKKKGNKGKT